MIDLHFSMIRKRSKRGGRVGFLKEIIIDISPLWYVIVSDSCWRNFPPALGFRGEMTRWQQMFAVRLRSNID